MTDGQRSDLGPRTLDYRQPAGWFDGNRLRVAWALWLLAFMAIGGMLLGAAWWLQNS